MNATIIAPPRDSDIIPLARQVLAECPEYIQHICNTLENCGRNLRAGNDEIGLFAFARGTSDLQQFVQLLIRMTSIARPAPAMALATFQNELRSCLREIELTMHRQDLVSMSDEIERALVPLLQTWNTVASELQAGFDHQAA
jgi:hypothetical protein